MKPKTLILMVIAIVCGLGASYMTSRLLAERNQSTEEAPKVKVLVAKKLLSVGTGIKKPKEVFEFKEYTQGQEPKGALRDMKKIKDKYLTRNLRKGDFVTAKDINDQQMILPVPKGMLGVGIRVNAETIAAGFASLPGSRVDVFLTLRGGTSQGSQCLTLLESVLVLAADARSNPEGQKQAMPASVVTVALTPEQAQMVNLAKESGTLSLALRNSDDDLTAKRKKLTMKQMLKNLQGVEEHVKPEIVKQEAPKPAPPKVEPKQPAPPVVKPQGPPGHKVVAVIKEGGNLRKDTYYVDNEGNVIADEPEGGELIGSNTPELPVAPPGTNSSGPLGGEPQDPTGQEAQPTPGSADANDPTPNPPAQPGQEEKDDG